MKKTTKKRIIFESIYIELQSIKSNILDEKLFDAGVGLGSLLSAIAMQIDKHLDYEEEEEDEEYEEKIEEEDDFDDFSKDEYKEEIEKLEKSNCKLALIIDKLEKNKEDLIKNYEHLISQDHIYSSNLNSTIMMLSNVTGKPEEIFYNMLPSKPLWLGKNL